MNRFEIPNIVEFDFPDLDPEFTLVTEDEIRNNKFNDQRLCCFEPIYRHHYGGYSEFATFFASEYTIAYIIGPYENSAALYKKSREMVDKINVASKILNSPYYTHTLLMNEGSREHGYAIFRIIIDDPKFSIFGSEYCRLTREFEKSPSFSKTHGDEYFLLYKRKSELSKQRLARMRKTNPNIDSLPDDTYIPIGNKKYKRIPFYSQPSYKPIIKPAIIFGDDFVGECTPEWVDGYIGVTQLSNGQWITDDTKIFYAKFGNNNTPNTPEIELPKPKYPTTPLGWFMRFKPKCELTPYRIKKLLAANVDLDSIPDDTYIPINDREYRSAPANSEQVTKQIAILEDAWDTLRDNKYIGYVDEPAEGFMTPEGVFYVEFS